MSELKVKYITGTLGEGEGNSPITFSGDTATLGSSANIKDAFSPLDSSASNGPTSGTGIEKNTTLPLYGCRAWVNFAGNSYTSINSENCCAIRASGNVSKVVRVNTGWFAIYFETAMPDTNYVTTFNKGSYGSADPRGFDTIFDQKTTYTRIDCRTENGNEADPALVCVMVFR